MNYETQKKLEKINELVLPFTTIPFVLSFSELKNIWKMAIYYNKLSNSLFKDNDFDSIVKTVSAFDTESKEVKNYSIKSNRKYNRIQFASIMIASENFLTYQDMKKVLELI